MRRTITALIACSTVLGVASPAMAGESAERRVPADVTMTLACEATTSEAGKPAIHCEWDAVVGAVTYKIMGVMHRGAGREVKIVDTTETSATKEARPGSYLIGVKAVDEDGTSLARSNRVRVTIERPARPTTDSGDAGSDAEASYDVREPVTA